jgi:hypothetical protein
MSEKTIAQKMYLKNVKSLVVLNGQVNPGVLAQLPAELIDDDKDEVDVILMFALNQRELAEYLPRALEHLGDKSSLWIAFLKQSASKATDLQRESIEAYAKERGITAVAMISLDGDWSALRFKRV